MKQLFISTLLILLSLQSAAQDTSEVITIGNTEWYIEKSENDGRYKFIIKNGKLVCYSKKGDTIMAENSYITGWFSTPNSGGQIRSTNIGLPMYYLKQIAKYERKIFGREIHIYENIDAERFRVCSFTLAKR